MVPAVRAELVEAVPVAVSHDGLLGLILKCRDGAYYPGHTEDVEARIAQHQSGAVKGFTSNRLPVTLAWCGDLPTREDAIAMERRIKGWTRAKKEALIASDWERLSLLARNRQDDGPLRQAQGERMLDKPRPPRSR